MIDRDYPFMQSVKAWAEKDPKHVENTRSRLINNFTDPKDKALFNSLCEVMKSLAVDMYGDVKEEKYRYIIESIMSRIRFTLTKKLQLDQINTMLSQAKLNLDKSTIEDISEKLADCIDKNQSLISNKSEMKEAIKQLSQATKQLTDESKKPISAANNTKTEFAKKIQKQFGSLDKQQKKTERGITAGFNQTKKAINSSVSDLKDKTFDRLLEIDKQISSIKTNSIFSNIASIGHFFIAPITFALKTVLSTFWEVIKFPFKMMYSMLDKYVFTPITTMVKSLWKNILKPTITNVFTTLLKTPQGATAIAFIGSYIWYRWINPLFKTLINAWDAIKPIFDPIVDWFNGNKNFTTALGEVWDNIWFGGTVGGKKHWRGLKQCFIELGDWLWEGKTCDWLTKEWKGIKGVLLSILDYEIQIVDPTGSVSKLTGWNGKAKLGTLLGVWFGLAAAHYLLTTASSIKDLFLGKGGILTGIIGMLTFLCKNPIFSLGGKPPLPGEYKPSVNSEFAEKFRKAISARDKAKVAAADAKVARANADAAKTRALAAEQELKDLKSAGAPKSEIKQASRNLKAAKEELKDFTSKFKAKAKEFFKEAQKAKKAQAQADAAKKAEEASKAAEAAKNAADLAKEVGRSGSFMQRMKNFFQNKDIFSWLNNSKFGKAINEGGGSLLTKIGKFMENTPVLKHIFRFGNNSWFKRLFNTAGTVFGIWDLGNAIYHSTAEKGDPDRAALYYGKAALDSIGLFGPLIGKILAVPAHMTLDKFDDLVVTQKDSLSSLEDAVFSGKSFRIEQDIQKNLRDQAFSLNPQELLDKRLKASYQLYDDFSEYLAQIQENEAKVKDISNSWLAIFKIGDQNNAILQAQQARDIFLRQLAKFGFSSVDSFKKFWLQGYQLNNLMKEFEQKRSYYNDLLARREKLRSQLDPNGNYSWDEKQLRDIEIRQILERSPNWNPYQSNEAKIEEYQKALIQLAQQIQEMKLLLMTDKRFNRAAREGQTNDNAPILVPIEPSMEGAPQLYLEIPEK